MVAPIYRIRRAGDFHDLPLTLKVCSIVLTRAGLAPLFLRALNNDCVFAVAATDDGAWIGWVAVRTYDAGEEISESDVGILCFAKATTPQDAAKALGEAIETGLSMGDRSPEGKRALERLQGDQAY